MGRKTVSIFDKLFKKKADEKAVIKFWKEFESRAELYANILADGDEDSEDYPSSLANTIGFAVAE